MSTSTFCCVSAKCAPPLRKPKTSTVALPEAVSSSWVKVMSGWTTSLKAPVWPVRMLFVQFSAGLAVPPRLRLMASEAASSLKPSMPSSLAVVRLPVSAVYCCVPGVAALIVASTRWPPVTLKPTPPGSPTRAVASVTSIRLSVASVSVVVPLLTSTRRLS